MYNNNVYRNDWAIHIKNSLIALTKFLHNRFILRLTLTLVNEHGIGHVFFQLIISWVLNMVTHWLDHFFFIHKLMSNLYIRQNIQYFLFVFSLLFFFFLLLGCDKSLFFFAIHTVEWILGEYIKLTMYRI